jgi:Zn-finger nucleic acid-binding protein
MLRYSPPHRHELDMCPDCRFDGRGNPRPCPKCEIEIESTKYVVLRILEVDKPSH